MWRKKVVPATTNNITQAIINHLLSEGHSASRVNVIGIWDPSLNNGLGGYRPSGTRKGLLDISAVLKPLGRALWIDVKNAATGDRLSKDQKQFIAEVEACGGLVFAAASYQAWLDYYNELKL